MAAKESGHLDPSTYLGNVRLKRVVPDGRNERELHRVGKSYFPARREERPQVTRAARSRGIPRTFAHLDAAVENMDQSEKRQYNCHDNKNTGDNIS